MSGGSGSRWGNHGGVPKHLFRPLGDGSILDRQVRQFMPHGEVVIMSGDERYRREGCRLVKPVGCKLTLDNK